MHGPDREVYFPQEHPPGREAQIDFTHGNSLGVTIGGQPYPNQFFQLVLSHSEWRYAEVAAGETFLALQQGLQAALWALGGILQVARSDNTSAATHEMRRSRGRALNDTYTALLDHYGLQSTRINRGRSHENGVAEQGHYGLKDAIDQALILRGIRDFDTTDAHAGFIGQMVERRNRLVQGKLEQERPHLRPCPQLPCPNTPTTKPGSASGAPSRHRDALTPFPPGSSARRGRYGCTPTGWKSTTRDTWWSGCPGFKASGKPGSITATSSAPPGRGRG